MLEGTKKAPGGGGQGPVWGADQKSEHPQSYPHHGAGDKRPMPPYGREFLRRAALDKRILRDVRVFVGKSAWRRAQERNTPENPDPDARTGGWGMVLPLGTAPSDYRWPVAGVDVLVLDDGTDSGAWDAGQELAEYLVAHAGAAAAWHLPANPDVPPTRLHRADEPEEGAA